MKRSQIRRDTDAARAFAQRGRESSARSLNSATPKLRVVKPTQTPKRKARTPRAGVASTVNPPNLFRSRVWLEHGGRCVVCGAAGQAEGAFDPAHLIPARMIRDEARATPALEDYVYAPGLAVWACRTCHKGHDEPGATGERTITRAVLERCGAWPVVVELAATMDATLNRAVGVDFASGDITHVRPAGSRQPFAAYLDRTFPAEWPNVPPTFIEPAPQDRNHNLGGRDQ